MSVSSRPRILLLSGYDVGSHRRWREQLAASQPEFDWQVLSLPPRHFRWRIRGNALSWLDEPLLRERWDLLVVTSMVDLATLKGFQPQLAAVPTLLYMHENQFAYPVSGQQHSSIDPQLVNLYSAIAADRVAFNSEWNRRSFLDSVAALLSKLPDAVPQDVVERIRLKSRVLPVPIDDSLFIDRAVPLNRQQPHLLWNHRWEYDKGPDRLFNLLDRLASCNHPFRLSVVGEQFRTRPAAFNAIHDAFSEHIVHWGYLKRVADYHRLLASADVVVSTAVHDFQGLAMLEAMASGCLALAPERLAYPEYVPSAQCYADLETAPGAEAIAAADTLVSMLETNEQPQRPEAWRLSQLAPQYRDLLWQMLGQGC